MAPLSRQAIAHAVGKQAPKYGVHRAWLFGSYARGEADEASDIDICIEHGDDFTLFALGGFAKHLEDELTASVDVICGEQSLNPRAQKRYRKDRVLLWESRT